MLSLLLLACACRLAESFSWGTSQCSSPMHASSRSLATGAVQVHTDQGLLHISASTPIRGYLISGKELVFSEIPANAQLTDVCGGQNTAVCHSNSTPRDSVEVRYRCKERLKSAELSIQVVFGYKIPYVSLSGSVVCPQIDAPSAVSLTTPSSA